MTLHSATNRDIADLESINRFWIADSEFHSEFKSPGSDLMDGQGGRPVPVCFVFFNPLTGEVREQFYRKGETVPEPPISLGNDTLLVAYTATAELTTMLALWGRMSSRPFDLAIEWLHIQNEEHTPKQMKIEARNAKGSEDCCRAAILRRVWWQPVLGVLSGPRGSFVNSNQFMAHALPGYEYLVRPPLVLRDDAGEQHSDCKQ